MHREYGQYLTFEWIHCVCILINFLFIVWSNKILKLKSIVEKTYFIVLYYYCIKCVHACSLLLASMLWNCIYKEPRCDFYYSSYVIQTLTVFAYRFCANLIAVFNWNRSFIERPHHYFVTKNIMSVVVDNRYVAVMKVY